MRRQVIFIFLLILSGSCNFHSNWSEFPALGLPPKDESYDDLIFTDSLTGYLGGNRTISLESANDQYQFTNRTVLYKTKDQGKSWLNIPLNYIGSVEKIFPFGDSLVILLQDVTADSVYILRTWNDGREWEELFSAPQDIYIREIHFTQSNQGYIITDDRHNTFLLKFQLNKWDTVLDLDNRQFYYKIIGNKIFSLISDKSTGNSTGVLVTNIKTGNKKVLYFDKPYFIASLSSDQGHLYLAAIDKNIGKILEISDHEIKILNLGEFSNYQPDKVFIFNNTILAIAIRQKDVSFLGVIHNLLISRDNGQTWELEEIPDPLYLVPATMYKDKFFMAYGGIGFIQVRKL